MREIKFRAIYRPDVEEGKAIIFEQKVIDHELFFVNGELQYYFHTPFLDKDWILSEFTGLHDKNDKDLDWWEGEIFSDAGRLKIIVKDQGCFWFEDIRTKRRVPCYETIEWADDIHKQGNIYENKDLLEQ
jgi:hypothetical protein